MKEFAANQNLVWVIPILTLCLLLILAATYALRNELRDILRNWLFPEEKRYIMPAQVISNIEDKTKSAKPVDLAKPEDGEPAANTASRPSDAAEQLPVRRPVTHIKRGPGARTFIEGELSLNSEKPKYQKGAWEVVSTLFKWYWRKAARGFKNFFGLNKKEKAQLRAAQKPQPTQERFSVPLPPVSPKAEPAVAQSARPGYRSVKAAAIAASIPQEPKEKTLAAPASQNPLSVPKAEAKPFLTQGRFYAGILILLTVLVVFLIVKMSSLTSVIEKQNAHIYNMQKNYEPKPQKRVIVYDIPAPKRPVAPAAPARGALTQK
jgi:hypothetical protein